MLTDHISLPPGDVLSSEVYKERVPDGRWAFKRHTDRGLRTIVLGYFSGNAYEAGDALAEYRRRIEVARELLR